MKQNLIKSLILSCSLISTSVFAGLMNSLDIILDNESDYFINNIVSSKDEKGNLIDIYTDNVSASSKNGVADFSMNFLGQLSQDLKMDLYNTKGVLSGSCSVHIGVGSYLAKPDFTGSECNLTNGEHLQINPSYEMTGSAYEATYKISKRKTFSRIIIFGDSMSDNGNLYQRSVELSLIFPISPILPASPPYHDGRFTNGKVWVEHLSEKLNIPQGSLLNYAYAGASVKKDYMPIPNLDKQVKKYLNWNRVGDPYALYVVWMGANDIMRGDDRAEYELIKNISGGIEDNIRKLIDHGARHILSPGLPDLSVTPDTIGKDINNGNKEYSERLTRIVTRYNVIHKEMLARLSNEFPEVNFMTFDVYKFLKDAHDHADVFGFTEIYKRCNPNSYWEDELETCETPKEYVFWDGIHPTAQAHKILSRLLFDVITKDGYEANTQSFRAKLPDDVVERNKKAVTELSKDIDNSNRKGYSAGLAHLRAVIDDNLQLY